MLRLMLDLRKARRLTQILKSRLRKTISQNKRRFTKHGFDLDLTYITNRVMAMSAPALGGHTAYRNDIHVVSRFLSLRHYGHFFVLNLCDTYTSSDGSMGNYHPQMLFNQVRARESVCRSWGEVGQSVSVLSGCSRAVKDAMGGLC